MVITFEEERMEIGSRRGTKEVVHYFEYFVLKTTDLKQIRKNVTM